MTVKATTGGSFDPDEEFSYFVAGSTEWVCEVTETVPGGHSYPYVLVAVNELKSRAERQTLDRLLDDPDRRVLLDSGIFNLAMTHARTHGVSHDDALGLHPDEIDGFAELWDTYADIATRYADRLWGVIELDQGGAAVKPETRARIETELGITPMPVYHPLLDDWGYYATLTDSYDRLCVGNLVKATPTLRVRIMHTIYERARLLPDGGPWHHFLGLAPSGLLLSTPLRRSSADSSSWLASVRWPSSWRVRAMATGIDHVPEGLWLTQGGGHKHDRRQILAMSLIQMQALNDNVRAHYKGMPQC